MKRFDDLMFLESEEDYKSIIDRYGDYKDAHITQPSFYPAWLTFCPSWDFHFRDSWYPVKNLDNVIEHFQNLLCLAENNVKSAKELLEWVNGMKDTYGKQEDK